MGVIIVAVLAFCLYIVVSQVVGLLRNIAKAKKTGFRYIVVPYIAMPPLGHHIYTAGSAIARWLSLPEHWRMYIEAMDIFLPYRTRHLWKDRLDDAYLIVSPGLMVLHLCNAELNHWVLSQRERFPKWMPMYCLLSVFGPNIVATEGQEWRYHRRLIAGSFTEAKTALVFEESVQQSLKMLQKWTGEDSDNEAADGAREKQHGGKMVASVKDDLTKLTLHIISYVGFGLQMLWPGETTPRDRDATLAKFSSLTAPAGYKVPFLDAIEGVLHRIHYVLVFPIWLLDCMPFKTARQAGREVRDYLRYSNELLEKRREDDARAKPQMKSLGMDFLGHLVRTSNEGRGVDRKAVIANTFMLQLAGHETTASTLFYTIVFLACFPEAQRRMQQDLDGVLGKTDPRSWEYSKVVNALLASNVGAAMYETLRLLPPALMLPKMAAQDEVLTKDGKQYRVPAGVPVFLETYSTGVDARYWPTGPSRDGTGETDILDYVPERWFREGKKECQRATTSSKEAKAGGEDEEKSYDDLVGPTTSEKLFKPVAGAYVPFSEGARSCVGRRMAQTELMASLAVVFRGHSIELAVDKGGAEDVRERSAERALYMEARRGALETLKTVRATTSLKLADGQQIGMRIVKRGEERFVGWMD